MNRYITIKGTTSDWYDEATFVLKSQHTQSIPRDLTHFADELVETHLKTTYLPPRSQQPTSSLHQEKSINLFFYIALGFLFIMILIYFLR
ncbi:MAG: hypothetical protein AB9856_11810 [Cellulosilyticaceae bacterium]